MSVGTIRREVGPERENVGNRQNVRFQSDSPGTEKDLTAGMTVWIGGRVPEVLSGTVVGWRWCRLTVVGGRIDLKRSGFEAIQPMPRSGAGVPAALRQSSWRLQP